MHHVRAESRALLGAEGELPPGASTSDSAETAPERRGRGPVYEISEKGGVQGHQVLIYKSFSASHEELMSPLRNLVIF